ncbi:interleukin 15, like [Halichoeres trimaculatus]|uniref:interleukin 15, like n=1 Tax=Halichoeres trimaculatus TaxID=147232 RepID=UPI003D9E1C65
MLIQRRGLASVYLCFFCLMAVTQKLAAQNCIIGIRNTVRRFIERFPLLLDCKLYTPSITDYQKCPRTAMKCFAEEVKVLIEEIKIVQLRRPPDLNMMLNRLAERLDQTNSECPQCELLQEETAADFLKALSKTLTVMSNSPGICSS